MANARRRLMLGLLALGLSVAPARAAQPGSPSPPYTPPTLAPEDSLYKSPIQLLLSKDSRQLLVACEQSGEVLVVDIRQRRVQSHIQVGGAPFGLAAPDRAGPTRRH